MNIKFIFSDLYHFFHFKLSYLKHNIRGARVTPSCRVDLNAELQSGTSFFGRTIINQSVTIEKHTYVTDSTIQNATIGRLCSIAPGVKIGLNEHPLNQALLHPYGYDSSNFNSTIAKTIIGDDVWVGANAIILSGIKIGDGAVVAAGAVVNKDVPPFSIVGGIPAKIIGQRNKHLLFDTLIKQGTQAEIKALIAGKEHL